MKKILFIFAACVIFSGCDFEYTPSPIESRLQGRWESVQNGYYDYSGTLIITSSTIEIKGFEKNFWQNDDDDLPFKGITKDTKLDSSSEKISDKEGIIYIDDFGTVEIPYQYQKNSSGEETLRFKFGERNETMKRAGAYWEDEDDDNDWDKEWG